MAEPGGDAWPRFSLGIRLILDILMDSSWSQDEIWWRCQLQGEMQGPCCFWRLLKSLYSLIISYFGIGIWLRARGSDKCCPSPKLGRLCENSASTSIAKIHTHLLPQFLRSSQPLTQSSSSSPYSTSLSRPKDPLLLAALARKVIHRTMNLQRPCYLRR